MSKNKENPKCPSCGNSIDPKAEICPSCGAAQPAPAEDAAGETQKRNIPLAILKVFFSVIFSAVLVAFTSAFSLLLFTKLEIDSGVQIPSFSIFLGDGLTKLAGSWLPIAFIAVFVCMTLLLLAVINAGRIRYFFICSGISLFISSLACLAIGIAEPYAEKYFIKELRSLLSKVSEELIGFEIIFAIAVFAAGLVCILLFILIWTVTKNPRDDNANMARIIPDIRCPYCGAPVRPELGYCESCRNPLPPVPMQPPVNNISH